MVGCVARPGPCRHAQLKARPCRSRVQKRSYDAVIDNEDGDFVDLEDTVKDAAAKPGL